VAEPPAGPFPAPVQRALFERRIILLGGTVDTAAAGDAAAALMTLDALGDDPIVLRLNADSDSLEAAFSLIDTIDVIGVDVHASVASTVGGTMVGVLAVSARRAMSSLGRIHLREPRASFAGTAVDLARHADNYEQRWEAFIRRLAGACGRPFEHVEADLRCGRMLDSTSALQYGLVDEVSDRRS